MNIQKSSGFFLILLLFFSLPGLQAQPYSTESNQFDTSDFPQWAKDLRRAEIIAFGSFPFTYFFSNFAYDTYRWSNNGWDTRYAPWPIKGAGAIEQNKDEKLKVIGIAAGGAVLIALIDYSIVRYKRNQKESRSLPAGTPIIVRTPLNGEETDKELDIPEPSTESP